MRHSRRGCDWRREPASRCDDADASVARLEARPHSQGCRPETREGRSLSQDLSWQSKTSRVRPNCGSARSWCELPKRSRGRAEVTAVDCTSSSEDWQRSRSVESSAHPRMPHEGIRLTSSASWCTLRPRLRRARMSRTSRSAAVIFTIALALSGDMTSFGPRAAHSQRIKPAWQWDGQRLFSCAQPDKTLETQCACYSYDPNAVVPCSANPPQVPDFETFPGRFDAEFTRYKSCTHDPKVQYGCKAPNDPVSLLHRPCFVDDRATRGERLWCTCLHVPRCIPADLVSACWP